MFPIKNLTLTKRKKKCRYAFMESYSNGMMVTLLLSSKGRYIPLYNVTTYKHGIYMESKNWIIFKATYEGEI